MLAPHEAVHPHDPAQEAIEQDKVLGWQALAAIDDDQLHGGQGPFLRGGQLHGMLVEIAQSILGQTQVQGEQLATQQGIQAPSGGMEGQHQPLFCHTAGYDSVEKVGFAGASPPLQTKAYLLAVDELAKQLVVGLVELSVEGRQVFFTGHP